ncbi:MAG: hypothetical protein WKF75_05465 [Singulisphaera sp.]
MRKDRPGTFKSSYYDQSVPGQYDARAWEDFRTEKNDPKVGGLSRKIEFTTRKGVRQTEREQIKRRIDQERTRIESQDPKFVNVPSMRSEQPEDAEKAGEGKEQIDDNDNSEDPDAGGRLVGTTWVMGSSRGGSYAEFLDDGIINYMGTGTWVNGELIRPDIYTGTWDQDGDSLRIEVGVWSFSGRVEHDRIEGTFQREGYRPSPLFMRPRR